MPPGTLTGAGGADREGHRYPVTGINGIPQDLTPQCGKQSKKDRVKLQEGIRGEGAVKQDTEVSVMMWKTMHSAVGN